MKFDQTLQVITMKQWRSDMMKVLLELAAEEQVSFLQRLHDEWKTGKNRFSKRGEVFLLAFLGKEVVGCCGCNQDPYIPSATIGRIRRFYVHPRFRSCGIGRRMYSLLEELVQPCFSTLQLRTTSEKASRFYLRCGFESIQGQKFVTHRKNL